MTTPRPILLLVLLAIAALMAMPRAAFAQASCSSATNDCFTANLLGAGCNNPGCCSLVCTMEPSCCDVAWDDLCVAIASKFCSSCGAVPESCFQPHPTPSCNTGIICESVCQIAGFEYCCNTQWDQGCVDQAILLTDKCGEPAAGSCLVTHENPNCNDATCCGQVCAIDPHCCDTTWDDSCVLWADRFCFSCGNPRAGNCCHQNESPFCNDRVCCEQVCAVDSFCCETRWDTLCGQLATDACGQCTRVCGYTDPANPAARACRTAHVQPGCSDAICCDEVCYFDAFCCSVSWDFTCVEAARAICAIGNNPQINAVCSTALGSCFVPHKGPGCTDASCCVAVCNNDPLCCDIDNNQWDETCAQRAAMLCNGCGDIDSGSCFWPHGTPSCLDRECCNLVCDTDPTCCTSQWDIFCVINAGTLCVDTGISCGDPRTRPCSVASYLPACEQQECCQLICSVDPTCCSRAWDETCAANAGVGCAAPNGCPGPGSPLKVHAQPGCSDPECCAAVCSVDPICCTFGWNERCVTIAKGICWSYGDCPGEEPCDTAHQSPGCADATCCSVVCRFEPFCCEVRWDSSCVLAARETCFGGCGQPVSGNCFNEHAVPGCSIGDCCQEVCADEAYEYCCQIEWDQDCAARAREVCSQYLPDCGDTGLVGCNIPHNKPACSDRACCTAVCAIDPFCCTTEWDVSCVQRVYAAAGCERYQFGCGDACAGTCCEAHITPWCNDRTCCDAVCLIDIFCCTTEWDQYCAATAKLNTSCEPVCPEPPCGSPEAGNCCFPHQNANCNDQACCETVCALDEVCCETLWDQICASIAATECKLCGGGLSCGDPDAGSCCNEHPKPYCNDAECCSVVCSFDELCCDTAWDTICVKLAQAFCACGQ